MNGPVAGFQAFHCYNLRERLMPHVRAQTARRLAHEGMRQSRIATHLGVSQAMVSKYLRTSPPPPPGVPLPALEGVIERSVESVLEQEAHGRLPRWCPLCPELSPGGTALEPVRLDECLRGEAPPGRDEAEAVLANVAEAARRLQGRAFVQLAPEVNINVAMAVSGAKDDRGVAALPGRLVEARGQLLVHSEPEFGASHHLSQILLRARRSASHLRAVLCLRDDVATRRALQGAGLRFRILRRVRGALQIPSRLRSFPDALVDPGAFGVEPITYLFGESALETVQKAERLLATHRHDGDGTP